MNYIIYIIFRFFVALFKITPFRIMFCISDMLAFFLHRIIKYRYRVISENLKAAFPDIDNKEAKRIIRYNYRNLTDLLLESIKSFTMSSEEISRHQVVLNPEIFDSFFENSKSVLGIAAHYGNWEWAALCSSTYLKHKPVGFYKPLSNKHIDRYLRENRSKFGMHLYPIKITAKAFEQYKEKAFFVLVGDQSPSRVSQAFWFKFLNRETSFIHGPEKYAKRNNLPVFYIDIQRTRRGYYTTEIIKLTGEPQDVPDGHITKLYAQKLEEIIRKDPSGWLWSHKRWKIKYQGQELINL